METRRREELRLAPGSSFKYNARMSVAFLPCVALVLSLGGKPVLGTLTVGLMISYILDALLLKRGAFFGVWGTLGSTGIALALSGRLASSSASWPLQALAFLVLMQLIFLLGVWASLQFKWLQLENPSVVLALERLLFACTPFTAAACQAWAVVAALGVEHAAFYLMAIQFLLYSLFALPASSSFRTKSEKNYGGQISEGSIIMGPLEGCLHTLMLIFLPLILHVGIHHRKLASSNTVSELVLLFFVPLLFQLFASSKGALWWLAKDPRQLHEVRVVNGAISAVAIVLALEVRVIFYAFNQYIQVPAPWSYILVTAACLGGIAAVGFCALGPVKPVHITVLLVAAAMSSALVLGMPWKFLPVAVLSAGFLAHFVTTRNIISYLIFVASAGVCITWFTVHHFWPLNIWIGGVPLKTVCKLIISSAMLAISVPGLSTLPSKLHHLSDVALVVQSILVCNLENRLFNYTSLYYYGMEEDVVYPSYMVVATTAAGLTLTRKMKAENRMTTLASWILCGLYCSKLSMLVISSKEILWVSGFLFLAISAPVLLYSEKGSRMKPWRGVAHAVVNFVLVWACRQTVSEAIQWWSGQHPSDSLLLGALVLVSGLASAPIVVYHFNHVQVARRALLLVLSAGSLCILLEPPFPKAFGLHRQQHWVEDELLYADTGNHPKWATWLLLLTGLTSLGAITSALPVQHYVGLRLVYALVVGASMGIYVSVQHFPGALIVGALLVAALCCAALVLVFVLLPSTSSPRFVPWLFALLVALLPVAYMLEGQQQQIVRDDIPDEERLLLSVLEVRGGRAVLLGVYAAVFMLIALVVKLQLASIVKEKYGSTSGSKHRLLQQHQRQQVLGVRKLAADGAWMPAVGNVATLACFLLCMVLSRQMAGGSNRAILLLAPILLLLNQDSTLLAGFGDRQRYFPLTAVISAYLTLCGAAQLWDAVWHETHDAGLYYAAKNTLLLLLSLPNHVVFNIFMWSHSLRPASQQWLLVWTSPLCFPALVATDLSVVRALALLAILYALVQYLVSRHVRLTGLKYI